MVQTVFAVVELSVRADSEAIAVDKVRNAQDYTKLPELESSKTILVKGVPVDNNARGISRMLEMAGSALEIFGRK